MKMRTKAELCLNVYYTVQCFQCGNVTTTTTWKTDLLDGSSVDLDENCVLEEIKDAGWTAEFDGAGDILDFICPHCAGLETKE